MTRSGSFGETNESADVPGDGREDAKAPSDRDAGGEQTAGGLEPEVMAVGGDPEVAEVAVLRFRGDDGHCVETVDGLDPPLARDAKWIINVSTQFGCPVGCPFCDAAGAYHGNCTAGEMLAQVRWALRRHPDQPARCAKLKVHFARMGEPALNDAVVQALDRLPAVARAPSLWACVATVGPRGRDGWFEALLVVKERRFRGRFQLQFSIQSTDAAARARLIPVPHWTLDEVADFGARFHRDGDRKVVLNFALARGVPFEPDVLVRRFDPTRFAVKLTPVNPTARGAANGFGTRLRSGEDADLERAIDELAARAFDVVVSVGDSREDRVGSNCGQAVRVVRSCRATAASSSGSGGGTTGVAFPARLPVR